MRVRCSLTHNSIRLHWQALAHWEVNPSGRRVRRDRADPDGRPGMQRKSQQIHLLREEFSHRCRTVTSSSCGLRWHELSQTLIWHWVIYDCLMTLFFTIVFASCLTTLCNRLFLLQINLSTRKAKSSSVCVCSSKFLR